MNKLADLFFETAILNKNKLAVWCEGESITYEELANLTSQYAHFLLNNGVKYGEHIGVTMNNSITSVALILAAANNGVGLVPVNPTMPKKALIHAFELANVKHIIATKKFYEKHEGITFGGKTFCLDSYMEKRVSFLDSKNQSKERPYVQEVNGNESFIITMTSGSTGNPKPILLTQENKYKRIVAHLNLYNITFKDRVLAATPLYHSLAERLVLIPLVIGGTCILMSRFTPMRWLEMVKNQRVTFTIAVSAQLNQIVNGLPKVELDDISSLRCVVSSSALLEEHVRKELVEKLECDFYEMYGTSEISTATSINFKESHLKQNSIGTPLKEASIRILKENGELANPYEVGEIICKTSLICNGYYGRSDLFNESVKEGYFKTGDLGYLDEDGYLFFSGRKKELIITGGINVYPIDIDKCVAELPEIEECAAFAYPNENLGEVVALAVILKKDASLSIRDIQRYCAKNLADYQQPQKIYFVESIPKNAMGKLLRTKIIDTVIK